MATQVPVAWGIADEGYRQHRALGGWLTAHRLPDVLATRRDQALPLGAGRRRQARVLAGQVHSDCWEHRSAGDGAHGQRRDDWAWVALAAPDTPGWSAWLPICRSTDNGELASSVGAGPATTTLAELSTVAGRRWGVEEAFPASEGDTGPDSYQVRTYTGWYRHVTLAMFAHARLAVLRAQANSPTIPARRTPTATS